VGIPYWKSQIGVVDALVPKRFRAEAYERLPALMYSKVAGFDLFVTECKGLQHLAATKVSNAPAIATPVEALALLGIYLRFRENYKYRVHATTELGIGRLGYASLAAEILVPSSLSLGPRAPSLITRLARTLYARDRIHRCYFDPENRALADEAFFYLDAFLVSLVAAFDLLARIANALLGFKTPERKASWRYEVWRKELVMKAPRLAELTTPGSKGRAILEICFLLRHHVHSDPLQSVEVVTGPAGQNGDYHLWLPVEDRDALREAMRIVGGSWGVALDHGEWTLINVPLLTERLIASSAKLLEMITQRLTGNRHRGRVSVQHLEPRMRRKLVNLAGLLLGVDRNDAYQLRVTRTKVRGRRKKSSRAPLRTRDE